MSVTTDPTAMFKQLIDAFQAQMASGAAASSDKSAIAMHSPETAELQRQWFEEHTRLWQSFIPVRSGEAKNQAAVEPAPISDRRFGHPSWSGSPVYDYLRRAYLLNASYLSRLVDVAPVQDESARQKLRFFAGQYIDALAPSNFAATNPEVIKAAVDSGGQSIRQGIQNLLADMDKGRISMTDNQAFEVGRNLAVTPGAVVFENELIQLIQYSPLTEKVGQVPLLIVPPCINKYYILDLQPSNSLVRHAVEQGNTVFLVSWRNVKAEHGHLRWDDYIENGVLKAIDVSRTVCATKQINALGFCVGGTLLTSALAVARARKQKPVKSLTLLTTFLDFSEPGDLGCYIDDVSVASREATFAQGGIYNGRELASVFSSLRANDLIWNYVVGNYLKGGKPAAFDLLFWNTDPTNLPGPFLVWYLRNMYLENSLRVPGKLTMCGEKVDLGKVDMPSFILATREDHIVPWRAAYASRGLLGGESTFVLGGSGHVAGVVNPANSGKRGYFVNPESAVDAESWLANAKEEKGSWWSCWSAWLATHAGRRIPSRGRLGNDEYAPTEPAPGRYVKEAA